MELEKINPDTCVYRLYAMRLSRVAPELEDCRYRCTKDNYPKCQKYKRLGNTQERYSHLKLYSLENGLK